MTGVESAQQPDVGSARGRTRFPCFDGFRAIAALSVLVYHAGFAGYVDGDHPFGLSFLIARLDMGVAIFFLVSGFLLYRPFVAAHLERRAGPDVRSYWRRRLLRILPAYWAALTIIGFGFHEASVRSVKGFSVLYSLTIIYFPRWGITGLAQAWSLCIELSFYAFLPVYAWMLGRTRRSPRRQLRVELVGVAALYASSLVFRTYASTFVPQRVEMQQWLLSTTDLFALGMLLAVLSAWYAHRGRQPQWTAHRAFPPVAWATAAFLFWVVAIPLDLGVRRYTVSFVQELARQTLYGLVALCLLLPGVFGPQGEGRIRRALQSAPVTAVGLVSYGVFLWHPFVIDRIDDSFGSPFPLLLGTAVVLSVGIAALSYLLVERRFLSRPVPRFGRRDARMVR
jgi:peptidoglycan/LPS O-acetylase OafA/YrhL